MVLEDPPEKKLFASHSLKVLGCNMHYTTIGEGKPIVLVHGWTGSWIGWIPIALSLRHKYKLYIPDMPGFGDSDPLVGKKHSVEELAKHLGAFIEKLDLQPEAIIGNSLGTFVTAQLTAMNPSITKHVILLGAVFENSLRQKLVGLFSKHGMSMLGTIDTSRRLTKRILNYHHVVYLMARHMGMYRFNQELTDLYSLKGRKKMKDTAFIESYISGTDTAMERLLTNPEMRVLILNGEHDRLSSLEFAQEKLKKQNGKISYKKIADAGHTISVEKPYEVVQEMLEFID